MGIPTLFRIWYSTTYTVLFFILLILLAVSPADTIYQSVTTRTYQKLFVVGGALETCRRCLFSWWDTITQTLWVTATFDANNGAYSESLGP